MAGPHLECFGRCGYRCRGDSPPGVRGGVQCDVRGLLLSVAVPAYEQHLASRPHRVGIDSSRTGGGRDVAPASGTGIERVSVARRSADARNRASQRYELVARPGKRDACPRLRRGGQPRPPVRVARPRITRGRLRLGRRAGVPCHGTDSSDHQRQASNGCDARHGEPGELGERDGHCPTYAWVEASRPGTQSRSLSVILV